MSEPQLTTGLIRMCAKYGVGADAAIAFEESLNRHIAYVREAGDKLGIPPEHLSAHDLSKFSEWEFPFYAKRFHGGSSPVDDPDSGEEFARAWLHHENTNPHHWGYWIPRSGKFANQPLEMPEIYVREMVADWMGASRAYTTSWGMSGWLFDNFMGMRMHDKTREKAIGILSEIGYEITIGETPEDFRIVYTAPEWVYELP